MSFLYLTHFLLGKGDPNDNHTQTHWPGASRGFSTDKLGYWGKIPVKTNEAVLLIFPARSAASFLGFIMVLCNVGQRSVHRPLLLRLPARQQELPAVLRDQGSWTPCAGFVHFCIFSRGW